MERIVVKNSRADISNAELEDFASNIVNASRGTFYRSNVHAYVAGTFER